MIEGIQYYFALFYKFTDFFGLFFGFRLHRIETLVFLGGQDAFGLYLLLVLIKSVPSPYYLRIYKSV